MKLETNSSMKMNNTLSLPNIDSLPKDPDILLEVCRTLITELKRANSMTEKLQHQIEKLLRHRYGRRSEQMEWGPLFSEEVIAEIIGSAPKEEEPEKESITYERSKPKAKGHGRQSIPAHLPRVREEVEVSEEDKTCTICGVEKNRIGEETSEQLEYVPASLFVKVTVRPVMACPEEHEVTTAPKPSQTIEKSIAGPGLLAQVAVSKYGDHLPLNRQEDIFSRNKVSIPRSTQSDWMRECAELCRPLYELMKQTILDSKVIHTDDTTLPLQDKKKTKKCKAWVYLDPIRQLAIFDFTLTRGRDGPEKFLDGYLGYIQADAYTGYDSIYAGDKVREVACWAHARRKFDEAKSAHPTSAVVAMAWIKRLYDVEREAKVWVKTLPVVLTEEERRRRLSIYRYELRQSKSAGIIDDFDDWLKEQEEEVLPKSPLGKAIAYTRNNWEALKRYMEDGDLSIDNNAAERAMRHVAVGRKNWLFVGSERGGNTYAVLTGLIYSAKLHKLDLFAYMKDIFTRLPDTPISNLEQFLPDVWKKNNN